jgi:hypothetical protein
VDATENRVGSVFSLSGPLTTMLIEAGGLCVSHDNVLARKLFLGNAAIMTADVCSVFAIVPVHVYSFGTLRLGTHVAIATAIFLTGRLDAARIDSALRRRPFSRVVRRCYSSGCKPLLPLDYSPLSRDGPNLAGLTIEAKQRLLINHWTRATRAKGTPRRLP